MGIVDGFIGKYKYIRSIKDLENIYDGSYAFVGVGGHSTSNLYPVLDYLHVPLKYICCKSKYKVPLLQRRFRNVSCTSSIDEILDDTQVKGVFVSAAPGSHYEIASKILGSGKSLFIEKPPCSTCSELNDLIEREASNNALLTMVGMQKRYSPLTCILRKKLAKSTVASYNLVYRTGLYPEGDSLLEIFIHPLDYVVFMFGKASVVGCRRLSHPGGGETIMLMLSHEHTFGMLELSTAYSWTDACENISINTSDGVFTLNQMEDLTFVPRIGSLFGLPKDKIFPRKALSASVKLYSRNNFSPTIFNNQIYTQGFYNEVKSFVELVEKNKGSNLSSFLSMLDTYKIIDEIRSLC